MDFRITNIVSRQWRGRVILRGKIINDNDFPHPIIVFFWAKNWISIRKKIKDEWIKSTPSEYLLYKTKKRKLFREKKVVPEKEIISEKKGTGTRST